MANLLTIRWTERFGGCVSVEILRDGEKEPFYVGDYGSERGAKCAVTRRLNKSCGIVYRVVTPEEFDEAVKAASVA